MKAKIAYLTLYFDNKNAIMTFNMNIQYKYDH